VKSLICILPNLENEVPIINFQTNSKINRVKLYTTQVQHIYLTNLIFSLNSTHLVYDSS